LLHLAAHRVLAGRPRSPSTAYTSADLILFLSDDLIVQRYVEMGGEIRKVMDGGQDAGSNHSKELRLYDVTKDGLVVGATLHDYRGIINGVPQHYRSAEAGTD
jgi:hypothetical protein